MSHPVLPADSGENNYAETRQEQIKTRASVRAGELEFGEGPQSLGNMSNNYLTGERSVSKVVKF